MSDPGPQSPAQPLASPYQIASQVPESPYAMGTMLGTINYSNLTEKWVPHSQSPKRRAQASKPVFLSLWGSSDEVNLLKMRGALMNIDPSLDKQTLSTYLSQAFQLPVAELPLEDDEKQEEIVVKLETAIERLQIADIKRVGPRGEPEPTS